MSTYKRVNMTQTPIQFDNCPDFLNRYMNYLSSFSNKKPSTVIEYCTTLREFFQYIHFRNRMGYPPKEKDAHKDLDITCMSIQEVAAMTQDDVETYLAFLSNIIGNKSATLAKKLALLSEFYAYIEYNADDLGLTFPAGNPTRYIPHPKKESAPAAPLTMAQVQKLMNHAFGETALRDKAIIFLIATTALSLSEVAALNRSDLKHGTLTVEKNGKGSRVIHLFPECEQVLNAYLTESDNFFTGDSALFQSSEGDHRRLTPRAIQLRISKIALKAGISGVTAQTLRDTGTVFLLSTVHPQNRRMMLKYLGYSSAHAAERFTKWLPSEDAEMDHVGSQIRRGIPVGGFPGNVQLFR